MPGDRTCGIKTGGAAVGGFAVPSGAAVFGDGCPAGRRAGLGVHPRRPPAHETAGQRRRPTPQDNPHAVPGPGPARSLFPLCDWPDEGGPAMAGQRTLPRRRRTSWRQGWSWRSGPVWSPKLRVLSACTPAVWSPLNGVVAPGQPAATASLRRVEPQAQVVGVHGAERRVRRRVRDGAAVHLEAGAAPGATAKVSMLNRPMNVPSAWPWRLLSRSPWYQEMPNGALGT